MENDEVEAVGLQEKSRLRLTVLISGVAEVDRRRKERLNALRDVSLSGCGKEGEYVERETFGRTTTDENRGRREANEYLGSFVQTTQGGIKFTIDRKPDASLVQLFFSSLSASRKKERRVFQDFFLLLRRNRELLEKFDEKDENQGPFRW
ncbi:hypothetical protein HZH68_012216 [Vespula germanica]|uniref:Uncharacterized protein n=1 Tax=Vespula germanica TaxID=30212 RepID=A0A834JJP3_VESGE|nr:hypothetical protein HZH68_012216 [Vespula germanica]